MGHSLWHSGCLPFLQGTQSTQGSEINEKEKTMSTKVATTINGVDLPRLTDTVAAVKASPELGSFHFRISNRWIGGGENRSEVLPFSNAGKVVPHKVGFTLVADEPDALLGTDNGANPVEHLLHALASCITTSTVYHAAARGIEVQKVESTLEGDLDLRGFLDLDPNVRNGFQNIRVKLRIKANATDEQMRELGQLGSRYSPVFDSVTRGVRVAISAERL
jgi:uncharacterized OsmC-like protein